MATLDLLDNAGDEEGDRGDTVGGEDEEEVEAESAAAGASTDTEPGSGPDSAGK